METVVQAASEAGMGFLPLNGAAVFFGLAAACAATPVLAGGLSPGNGGTIVLPSVLPPSVHDALAGVGSAPVFDALGQKFGVQAGHLDFFSAHPASSGDFKPLLHAGVGDGGLRLQLKW